jgi:hypothetical protein
MTNRHAFSNPASFSNLNIGLDAQPPDDHEVSSDGMMLYNCHSIIQRDKPVYVYGEDSNLFYFILSLDVNT